ncbi:MAG: helix-turn-helix transcriptional regulator [Proteiniphilum sp.]|nr:helix-turn-helix transcriptional regulator [Proteiniphilum sp.]
MENNKEKFLSFVAKETSKDILEDAKYYVENSDFIRFSNNIALLILDRLDQLKWTRKQLAEAIGVSPQQVSKWVKGGENLTISTIINISNALGFNLLRLNMC